jgi:ribosomal protein S18 acetylase RimI-like enzyme
MSTPFLARPVVRATPADATKLACLIADAFHSLAPSRWLVPDEQARRDIFPGYFQLYVKQAFAQGVVETTADQSAVALWLDNPGTPQSPDPDYDDRLAAITGIFAPRFRLFDEMLDARHPLGTAHQHLAILGVAPQHQRCGLGTALLQHHHRLLDEAGIPAYLEASDEHTRELYLKHGYVDQSGAILLPDGPRMYPLWREPRSDLATPA